MQETLSTQEIIEGNKLIAEFMGLKLYPKVYTCDEDGDYATYSEMEHKNVYLENPTEIFDKHLRIYLSYYENKDLIKPYEDYHFSVKYHKSWDWLMSSIEKISKLENVYMIDIHPTVCTIHSDETFISPGFFDGVYKSVVKFIKWYNEHNPR